MAYNLISDLLPVQYKEDPLKPQTPPLPQRQPVSRPKPTPPLPKPAPPPTPPNTLSLTARLESLGKPVPKFMGKAEEILDTPVSELIKNIDKIKMGEPFTNPMHNMNYTVLVFMLVLALAIHLFVKKSIKHIVQHNDVSEIFIIFMYAVIVAVLLWLMNSYHKAHA